jgi:hypothetical protein
MFGILSAEIGRQVCKRGLSEDEILADFASWRKSKHHSAKAAKHTGRNAKRPPRGRTPHLSKFEAERLRQFKALMKRFGGRGRFAGCDE